MTISRVCTPLEKRFDEAERLAKKTLETQRRVLGQDDPDTTLSMNILGSIYYRQGRYSDAEPISSQTLEISRRVLGEEHPDTLVEMHNLATIYDKLRRYDEAERIYLEDNTAKRRVLGTAPSPEPSRQHTEACGDVPKARTLRGGRISAHGSVWHAAD